MNTQLFSLKNFTLFFLLGFMIVISSCKEEPDLVGMSLQSENERLGLGFTDTTTIVAYSVFDDSLRTDNYSSNLLGTFNDPVFGTTSASIFTQVRLSTLSPGFPSTAIFDSLVLYMPYSGNYAVDLTTMGDQELKVYEVTDKMYIDSIYYSDRLLGNNGVELADYTFTPKPNDSVTIDGIKYPPILKIKLNTAGGNALGEKLLHNSGSSLADNDAFTAYFKGLFVKALPLTTTQENKGSILYFNLLSSYANMTMYYKKTAADTVSTKYNFVINDKSAKYTHFNHYGYNGANSTLAANNAFRNQLGVGVPANPSLGAQQLYIQSMGGVKVFFKFPFLRDLVKNQKVVVNEAVLVIKNDDVDEKNAVPSMVTILKRLADGKTAFLPDLFEGLGFFGGTYNATTKEYRMRVTRYLQYMLNTIKPGDIDYGLVLLVDSRRTTANRFVFKGTDQTMANKMKLELKYTVIK